MDEIKERDPEAVEPEPIDDIEETRSDWQVVLQFFVIPLVVIAIGASIFFLFGMLTQDSLTASDYLSQVRTGSKARRYQAAYELSKYLVYEKEEALSEPGFAPALARVFQELDGEEPEVRRYLALALGLVADPRTVEALLDGLDDPDSQTQIYAIWALGSIGNPVAVPALIENLSDSDSGVRKMASHALGALGDESAIPALQAALADEVVDVRWNVALSLGQLADPAGKAVLYDMMSRQYLDGVPGLTAEQKNEAIMNAIRVLAVLEGFRATPTFDRLAKSDPDLEVRSVALDAVAAIRGAS